MTFWVIYFLLFGGMVFFVIKQSERLRRQRKYNLRKDQDTFYFEDGDLVLNSLVPQYAPVSQIDHVCFTYDIWSIENRKRYSFNVKIVMRDGTQTKDIVYTSFSHGNHVLRPKEIAAALEAQGIRCELPTGKGSLLRGNH